jgi:hypothetical protein
MSAIFQRINETNRRNTAKCRVIGILFLYSIFMHPGIAISSQNFNYWTKPNSLNDSAVRMESDFSVPFSSTEESNNHSRYWTFQTHKLYGFLAYWKNATITRGLGYSSLMAFQDQPILEWGSRLFQCYEFTRDFIFLGDRGGRVSRTYDNRVAPIYYDANNRIYR